MGGDVTTLVLKNLLSQTEYDLAVTPVYAEGPGNTMINSQITGQIRSDYWNLMINFPV